MKVQSEETEDKVEKYHDVVVDTKDPRAACLLYFARQRNWKPEDLEKRLASLKKS